MKIKLDSILEPCEYTLVGNVWEINALLQIFQNAMSKATIVWEDGRPIMVYPLEGGKIRLVPDDHTSVLVVDDSSGKSIRVYEES